MVHNETMSDKLESSKMYITLTVARERVRPLVQRGIKLRNDVLFPLLVTLPELRSRFIGRVLRDGY